MTLTWILLATFLGGALSAALASLFLLLPEARRTWLLPHLISFATGAMLAAALIGLLPEAHRERRPAAHPGHRRRGAGRHRRCSSCSRSWCSGAIATRETARPIRRTRRDRDRAAGWIVLFGDGVHNAFDGVLIAAAFLTDVEAGRGDDAGDHRARDSAGAGRSGRAAARAHEPGAGAVVQRGQQPDLHPRRPGWLLRAAAHARRAALCDLGGRGLADLCGGGRPDPEPAPAGGRTGRRGAGAADRLRGGGDRGWRRAGWAERLEFRPRSPPKQIRLHEARSVAVKYQLYGSKPMRMDKLTSRFQVGAGRRAVAGRGPR